MRKTHFLAAATVFTLVFAAGADFAIAQRGGGRGGFGRGGGRGAPLDDATITEEFDKIVEVIWTDDEKNAWKNAKTDEQKQAFIAAFWESRDPTPGTADNEFRDVWMERVNYANRAFNEGRPGYETERGKFYLIYGPEAMVAQETKNVASGGGNDPDAVASGGGGSLLIWTLDPTQNPFLDGKEDVTWARYQRSYSRISGGFEYSQEAFLAGKAVQQYFEARRANPAAAGPGSGARGMTPGAAATAGAPLTPDRAAMQELLQNGVTRQDFSLQQSMDFVPAPPNTFSIFNFEVGKSGLTFGAQGAPGPAALMAFGVLLKKDPAAANGEQYFTDIQMDFTADPSEGDAEDTGTHSFAMTLEPGAYRLAWGVMDKASERMVTTSYEFEVPNYAAGELGIPSVMLATAIEPQTDEVNSRTVYAGTRVGNLLLSTDLDGVFGRNDTVVALYFIQGLATDPATQAVSYEVDHRILIAGTDQSIARLPTQTLGFAAVQQEIPLARVSQLEPGKDYEIEIHIKDLVGNREITQKVPFSTRGE